LERLVRQDLRAIRVHLASQGKEDLLGSRGSLDSLAPLDRKARRALGDNQGHKGALVRLDLEVLLEPMVNKAVKGLVEREAISDRRVLRVRRDPPETLASQAILDHRVRQDQ